MSYPNYPGACKPWKIPDVRLLAEMQVLELVLVSVRVNPKPWKIRTSVCWRRYKCILPGL